MGRDSDQQQQCFVFMIKVADNFPLYGCCWYVHEMLHRPPYLARGRYRSCHAPFRQCMIAAPRCYCLLSRYPFFELHFRVSRSARCSACCEAAGGMFRRAVRWLLSCGAAAAYGMQLCSHGLECVCVCVCVCVVLVPAHARSLSGLQALTA
ncbi:hypothetical protein COO60DRAFT_515548 [Scenedesmus sp. NREL 46B-D3]|nr:hypothetical protein COO60DRAFT_515548 [Scenedesmus sp. NREL 46B-D3]